MQTTGAPGCQPDWMTLGWASWEALLCVLVMIGTVYWYSLVNWSTGESSWLSFLPRDITVISCLSSFYSKSAFVCLYNIIYKSQCNGLVLSIISQCPMRKEINLQTFLTATWKLHGQSRRLQKSLGQLKRAMHHDMTASHLIQLSISGTKPMRTGGRNRQLTGLIHLLEKTVVGIGSFSLKMCVKYIPCLQVQFATESLISIPWQQGNILIDKTCWFWLKLQSARFTILHGYF